ncbi:hypothetical protein BGZ61DRAFT_346710 [Ilyonectria robusta]|uniref:uncharacterized protein n=1 Tax=Ilyonectria robusta TaxID=1079257 RepID=UPI001E8DE417|nr:uncharacterized protein BGZ61DRAFT_346710 [Ilyonectria robusta]KAH8729155.1 hypothetical protein BGZ61DRAFT_346710 [Ilyonectria robusta]
MATRSANSSDESSPARAIYKTTFRTASPYLRRLPLVAEPTQCPESILIHKRAIINRANDILEKYKLLNNESSVEILNRRSVYYREDVRLTLFIITAWNDESFATWPQAVREIVDFIEDQTSALPQAILDVEMIAPERVKKKYLGLVGDDPALHSAWPSLGSLIQERLELFEATSSHYTSIGLFRLGYSEIEEDNPITVYIPVEYDSDETEWPVIIDDILSTLASHGWPQLHVHIEHEISFGNMGLLI